MVGRTPEYLGKKIEGREMKLAVLAVLYFCVTALGFAALAAVLPAGKDAALNPGPHGLSEILYATISQTGNNGSAFAGLTASGRFCNTIGGLCMMSAASSSSSRAWPWRARWPGRSRSRPRRHVPDHRTASSWCCWSA